MQTLEIFASDTCCSKGGHSLHVRYHENNQVWTEWLAWGSQHDGLEAVSGYPPPIQNLPRHTSPTKKFRLSFAGGSSSEILPINVEAEALKNAMMKMDTTGLLDVSRTEGGEGKCRRTGWCSWDVTFMTNVLFETNISTPSILVLPPFEVETDSDNDGTFDNEEDNHRW